MELRILGEMLRQKTKQKHECEEYSLLQVKKATVTKKIFEHCCFGNSLPLW